MTRGLFAFLKGILNSQIAAGYRNGRSQDYSIVLSDFSFNDRTLTPDADDTV